MKPVIKWTTLALAVCLPLSAQAHRAWMLPSATVLSGEEPWITVDAAVSNDLFYFEHVPMRLKGIGEAAQAPAGGPPACAGRFPNCRSSRRMVRTCPRRTAASAATAAPSMYS